MKSLIISDIDGTISDELYLLHDKEIIFSFALKYFRSLDLRKFDVKFTTGRRGDNMKKRTIDLLNYILQNKKFKISFYPFSFFVRSKYNDFKIKEILDEVNSEKYEKIKVFENDDTVCKLILNRMKYKRNVELFYPSKTGFKRIKSIEDLNEAVKKFDKYIEQENKDVIEFEF